MRKVLFFTFENHWNFCWVYQDGDFLPGKKHFKPRKKSEKVTLPPSEKIPSYAPAPQTTPSAGYDYSIACLMGLQAWTWVSKVLKSLWPRESHSVSQNQGLALTEEYIEPFDVEFTTFPTL